MSKEDEAQRAARARGMAPHLGASAVSPDTCRKCSHYDCMMDRGEVLPEHVTAWTAQQMPVRTDHISLNTDGTITYYRRYEPNAAAQALHNAIHWARFCNIWSAIFEQ